MKNNILSGLLSLLLAIGVWLYVVTVVSPNSDKKYNDISIVTQNEIILQERGFMVTNIDTSKIELHLGGSRSDLNKLHWICPVFIQLVFIRCLAILAIRKRRGQLA